MTDFSHLYQADYFGDRFQGSDPLREAAYAQEIGRIRRYVSAGRVLDVGCGMGNFLLALGEDWEKHGIEVSEFAREQATKQGIRIIDYDSGEQDFDLIVLRGVLQHLDTPFYDLQRLVTMLKPGGHLVFLATPNTNSPYYRRFGTLPMLDPPRNFLLPSDLMLRQILLNLGLEVLDTAYPYLGSPYARPLTDHLKFVGRLLGMDYKFAFWRSMMEMYSRKPD